MSLRESSSSRKGTEGANGKTMTANEISKIDAEPDLKIHKRLIPALPEYVYEETLSYEHVEQELHRRYPINISTVYEGLEMELVFRANVITGNIVIVELKSVESILDAYKNQLLVYLKQTGLMLELLMNFDVTLLKNKITRMVNNL